MLSIDYCDTTPLIAKKNGISWRKRWIGQSKQFFETINPLDGFDGKESFETYMWNQSLKIEPKDIDKMEIIKPSRPANVLKSPGIKLPKNLPSVPSTSGTSNHYAGYRGSGRGFSPSFHSHNHGVSTVDSAIVSVFVHIFEIISWSKSWTATNLATALEEKNSHLGMVEINPGCQPRYLGDAFRGQAVMTCPIRPPPLVPRTRRDKAASTPPTPLENTTTSVCSSIASTAAVKLQGSTPPPLYPRRISPQFFALPNFSVPHSKPCDESPPEQKAPWSSTLTDHKDLKSLNFTSNDLENNDTTTVVAETGITNSESVKPAVPPRMKTDALPAPLSPETVRVVWSG
ncbi:unnamed protein product [Dracunculus medinensis]|uniref:Hydroxyproline-rich glycoprotein family protein n=1 Tax=Dracunculus medinensis TaxID=318479 RepID=A0A0N4U4T3_DRAME|nr:unnamed protein product [Dracunculus medinensis]